MATGERVARRIGVLLMLGAEGFQRLTRQAFFPKSPSLLILRSVFEPGGREFQSLPACQSILHVLLLLALLFCPAGSARALNISVDTLIDHGMLEVVSEFRVGDGTTNPVTLTVRNPGTLVRSTASGFVGDGDSGRLVIENGAQVDIGTSSSRRTLFAARNGGTAEIIVDGTGSNLRTGGFELAGDGGQGTLQVLDGGLVSRVGSGIARISARGNGATASVLVSGAGSRIAVPVTVDGSVRVESGGVIDRGVSAANGTSVVVTGAGSTIGAAELSGDSAVIGSTASTATLLVEDGGVVNGALRVVAGSATFRTGASLDVGGIDIVRDSSNDSTLVLESGITAVTRALTMRGSQAEGGLVDLSQGGILYSSLASSPPTGIDPGTVRVATDGAIRIQGPGGRIVGDVVSEGLVTLVNTGGLNAPPTEGSRLTISGNLDLLAAGELSIALEGLGAGIGHDIVEVAGDATIDGLLSISVAEELLASIGLGDTLTILESASAIQGAFNNLANGDLLQFDFDSGFVRFSIHYGAASTRAAEKVVLAVAAFDFDPPVVPEPTLLVLVGPALLGGLVRAARAA